MWGGTGEWDVGGGQGVGDVREGLGEVCIMG